MKTRIAGYYCLDGQRADLIPLQRMVRYLSSLDCNSGHTLIDGPIGLACIPNTSRLSENRNNLLHHDPFALALDGRIDNRDELISILQPRLRAYPSINDDLIVSTAYEKWGVDCVQHILGDFAFTLWNKETKTFFCARDHLGVKPFYYAINDRVFIFASTPNTIIASHLLTPQINDARIADFLVNPLEGLDKTSTFIRQIQRLPPAHFLAVRSEAIQEKQYWAPGASIESGANDLEDYLEPFRELLGKSIACRLSSGQKTAAMLSGGMDSSSICAIGNEILTKENKNPLTTISVVSDSQNQNRETTSIRACLHSINFRSFQISETQFSHRTGDLIESLKNEEEPFDNLMNLNRAVYLCARDHQIDSIMDGVDGDILLSDVNSITCLWRSGAIKDALGETLGAGGLVGAYGSGLRRFIESLQIALVPEFARDIHTWIRQSLCQKRERNRFLKDIFVKTIVNPEFANQISLSNRLEELYSKSKEKVSSDQISSHIASIDHPFLTVGLERYERVASSFGVEASHPLLDIRLISYCLGLPWYCKTHHGWTKTILRQACKNLLPSEVIWRKDKDSLMWYFNFMLLMQKADYFIQLIRDERETLSNYVDYPKLSLYCDEFLHHPNEEHAVQIWNATALAMWLQQQRELGSLQ